MGVRVMDEADEDELFRTFGELLYGKPIEMVIPILIVAAARALAIEFDGDEDKLSRRLGKFGELLAGEAFDMLHGKKPIN